MASRGTRRLRWRSSTANESCASAASSLEEVFCAELVATTYQHMGLLAAHRPAGSYDPGRFWSGDHIALAPPFALGAEIAVR
jgi:hypothetical protein